MSEREKMPYIVGAKKELNRAPYLENDIKEILQKTMGSITWRQLQSQLAGSPDNPPIISYQTIRRHVMGLEGSCYKINSFQPSLSEAHKQKRYQWSKAFWVFWNAAKVFKKNKKVMLTHMDEKWFYAVVV